MRRTLLTTPLLLAATACTGSGSGGATSLGTSGTDSATSTSGSSTSTGQTQGTSSTTGTTGSTGGTGFKFDLDPGTTTTGAGDGCDKVDFLFVVDNSSSMLEEQLGLIAAFPQFLTTIQATLQGQSYHIMVVDSDDDPTYACEVEAMCNFPLVCEGYNCGDVDLLDTCDKTLGAGGVRPYGGQASNMDCAVEGGGRFITENQTDVDATFACIAKVGVSGSRFEMPFSAASAAVGDTLGAVGACNEGFIRDDAILVVTVISDDPSSTMQDDATPGTDPMPWFDAFLAAKNGNQDAIVVLGLFGSTPPTHFEDMVELFGDHGIWANGSPDTYPMFFQEAVDIIDTTCDEFTPEG